MREALAEVVAMTMKMTGEFYLTFVFLLPLLTLIEQDDDEGIQSGSEVDVAARRRGRRASFGTCLLSSDAGGSALFSVILLTSCGTTFTPRRFSEV